jgi:AhpD family alkylhydroperoxidase
LIIWKRSGTALFHGMERLEGRTHKETHMKINLSFVRSFILLACLTSIATADPKPAAPSAAAAVTLKEIEQMVGFVPAFMRQIPAALLPSWWQTAKDFEMNPQTALDGKTKELIGLAVAAQIPCEYCVIYHTEAARGMGASEEQIREAVGMAAVTRESSTILNGLQIDKTQFRKDLDRMHSAPHPTAPTSKK